MGVGGVKAILKALWQTVLHTRNYAFGVEWLELSDVRSDIVDQWYQWQLLMSETPLSRCVEAQFHHSWL